MLKVGSPQPPMDNMPPMDRPIPQGVFNDYDQAMTNPNGDFPPMDNQMSQDGMGNTPSEFDTNFDAGVDADENTDPKKYIQQLTGKLSQSLRKYNNEQPKVDSELNKYVAGMILKQSTERLSSNDKKDVIDKVSGDENNTVNPQMEPSDTTDDTPPMMESINTRQIVNELFQELTKTKDSCNINSVRHQDRNSSFKKKPFSSPNLK